MNFFFIYLFLIGPFRTKKLFSCDTILHELLKHDELQNITEYLKNVIGNTIQNDANKKIVILNNRINWIKEKLNE